MIILGVDPGLRAANPAGWALYRVAEGDIAAGVVVPPRGPWEHRAAVVGAEVARLAGLHGADALACEDAYLGESAQTFRQLVAFGWELRVQARLLGLDFALVAPAAQAALIKGRRALPAALLNGATAHLPAAHRPHAQSAMAIAWHGAGLVALSRRRELSRLAATT